MPKNKTVLVIGGMGNLGTNFFNQSSQSRESCYKCFFK